MSNYETVGRPGIYSKGLNIITYSNPTEEKKEDQKQSVNFIEYIESTGTQYIDTGYTPNKDTVWKVEMQYTELTDGKNRASGMIVKTADGTYNRFYFGMATSKSYQVGIGTEYKGAALKDSGSFVLYGNGKAMVNDKEILLTELMADNSLSLRLFSRSSNVTSIEKVTTKARLYGSVIEENGILIQDLRPCKDPDGVCCLYDTVTEKYFYNQGTGEFLSP